MSFWEIVILVWVMAMVIRPLMLLRPNKQERQKAALRQRATAQGMRVTLDALPRQRTDQEAPKPLPVYRQPAGKGGGPRQSWLLMRAAYEHEVHFLGGWAWQGSTRASAAEQACLRAQLPQLPPAVRAVGGNVHGWCVYWTERGGEATFCEIETLLKALRDCNRLPASAPD